MRQRGLDVLDRQIPQAPVSHANETEHRRLIAQRANAGLPTTGTRPMEAPLILKSYTVAGLPAAGEFQDGLITVSDETDGYTTAFSDGTNWRRVQDRAIVS